MDFTIKSEYDKKTVKEFVKTNIGLSRNTLIMLKNKPDGITVNGVRVTVRHILSEGDVLSLSYEDADKSVIAQNHSLLHLLDIIYEDDFLLAVNKPPYMPSHPSINHYDDTLANIVAAYYKNNNINSLYRAVNRLDKNTSGIVLIAKDKVTSARLNDMMKRGEIRKTYIAVLSGNIHDIYPEGRGCIINPIKRECGSIIKRVCAPDGDYAETEFKILKYGGDMSVVEVCPKTGRTHQIRLHFHSVGTPLVGEDLYCENTGGPIARHALHACALEFIHPETNKKIILKCELPDDIKSIII